MPPYCYYCYCHNYHCYYHCYYYWLFNRSSHSAEPKCLCTCRSELVAREADEPSNAQAAGNVEVQHILLSRQMFMLCFVPLGVPC